LFITYIIQTFTITSHNPRVLVCFMWWLTVLWAYTFLFWSMLTCFIKRNDTSTQYPFAYIHFWSSKFYFFDKML
jgi:hypothetical protein